MITYLTSYLQMTVLWMPILELIYNTAWMCLLRPVTYLGSVHDIVDDESKTIIANVRPQRCKHCNQTHIYRSVILNTLLYSSETSIRN